MKKSLLALAVLGALSGVAQAQSSVTLFGIVDVNARSVKNGGATQKQLSTDGINSSRLGFRGIEDLGGGLKAGFWLEAGLSPDVGNAGGSNGITPSTGASTLFNRRSTVSLIGSFGEVRLGRDYDPTFWNLTNFDPFGTNGVGSSLQTISALGSGVATLVRANNTIGYFLPSGLGGLYGQAQVAAGEGVNGQKYYGGRLGYAAGPFDIAAAYGKTEATPSFDYKIANVAGSWNFEVVKIMGQWVDAKYDGNGQKQTNWLIGAVVPMGQGEIHASFIKANRKGTGVDGNDAKEFAVGYVYNLSKRTALYGTFAQIDNDGTQNFIVASGPAVVAGRKSTGYEFGVRHSF